MYENSRSNYGWLGFTAVYIFTHDWMKVFLGTSKKYHTDKPITGRNEEQDRPHSLGRSHELFVLHCAERETLEETGWSDTVFQKLVKLDEDIVEHSPPEPANKHAPSPVVGVLKPKFPEPVPNYEFEKFSFWDIWDVVEGKRIVEKNGVKTTEVINPVYAANHCAVLAEIALGILDGDPKMMQFASAFPKVFLEKECIAIFQSAKNKLLQQYDMEMRNRYSPRNRAA